MINENKPKFKVGDRVHLIEGTSPVYDDDCITIGEISDTTYYGELKDGWFLIADQDKWELAISRRLIFLDIDGVLNHEEWYNKTRGMKGDFDPHCIELLNQLKGAEIVISSSWGNFNGETEEKLKKNGLKLPVVGVTKKWHYKYEWVCRGNEVEAWLFEEFGKVSRFRGNWGNENYEYIILDDDDDMLLEQTGNFIKVNRWVGLTQEDIDKAKQILRING